MDVPVTQLHAPRPPKDREKPVLMASVCTTQPTDEVGQAVQEEVTHPGTVDADCQPLDCMGIRLDDQGMILPYSILGSLEDFRSYLEAKGETELVKRIPQSQMGPQSEGPGSHHSEAAENGRGLRPGIRNTQNNALQHWQTHMAQRRRQQGFLSDILDRPVENLLMNQDKHFREIQEQREFLNQVMPLIHSGYGYRVGSEFWSLPQRYGDEMSGISATLTQTEQGRREPVTRVAQPRSIRQESGITGAETLPTASGTGFQSAYLQQQLQELGEILQDVHMKKPDIDGLEVIGSRTFVTVCCSPLLEKKEEEKQLRKENIDPLAQHDDVQSDAVLVPALRFCGKLACWTGNSTTNQEELGISVTIIFEAFTGETASSHLKLHNEGSAAIFYSWQQLLVPRTFPNLRSQTKRPCFYFNSSSGMILPGETKQMEFMFKSQEPGIQTELWQLNTHPLLMQGASMRVTLRGVALYQDKTADQRLFIEEKLERVVMVKLCRSIVYEVLQGVHTPERPSSPAELYVTEEQEFLRKNPKLQYHYQPVQELKRLWQEVNLGHPWELCVDTLRQVVLSLPDHESAKETSLAQLNSLLLDLSELPEHRHHLTAADVRQQLWRKLLDTMVVEAMRIRNLLGLPERDTWIDKKEDSQIADADLADQKDRKSEAKGGAADKDERSGVKSRPRDLNRGESRAATTDKSVEDSRKKTKRKDEAGKRIRGKQGRASSSPTDPCPDESVELMDVYTRLLHRKVYALMEDLVDSLCDLMDEFNEEDE